MRTFFVLLMLAVLFQGCGKDTPDGTSDRPNVILLSLDTLRADHLHCYGYEKDISPTMDGLAADGVLFENVFAQSSWTLPSHVSMLSSLYPSSHGVTHADRKIPGETLLLSEIFKNEGYCTGSINGSGYVSARYGFDQGFDLYEEIHIESGNMAVICNRAIDWIDENREQNFFLFLHTYEPHGPYSPPDSYKKSYVSQDAASRERFRDLFFKIMNDEVLTLDELGFLRTYKRCRLKKEIIHEWKALLEEYQANLALGHFTERESLEKLADLIMRVEKNPDEIFQYWRENRDELMIFPYLRESYEAEIMFADTQIARILAAVGRLGLQEKTLIVLTSDHGEEFIEHGKVGHAYNCYNETIHVPLIFYYPGHLPEGRRISENTALIDVPPTILELIGIPVPGHFQGISLVPMIQGSSRTERRIFSEGVVHHKKAYWPVIVIDGAWKYHFDSKGTSPDELYDLESDPGETVNLAAKEPDLVERLKGIAEDYLDKAPPPKIEKVTADQELQQQLQELGYVH